MKDQRLNSNEGIRSLSVSNSSFVGDRTGQTASLSQEIVRVMLMQSSNYSGRFRSSCSDDGSYQAPRPYPEAFPVQSTSFNDGFQRFKLRLGPTSPDFVRYPLKVVYRDCDSRKSLLHGYQQRRRPALSPSGCRSNSLPTSSQ
jgi:hypothetical protein